MPYYIWVAETKKGRKLKGEIEAADEKIAMSQLKRRNLNVLKLKPKPKDLFEGVAFMQPKVTNKDVVIFTRQFSTMIDAGLPLVQGLSILAEQSENKTFKGILKEITKDVELALEEGGPPQAMAADTVTLMITEEPDVDQVTVHLLDATTGITLARLDGVPFAIAL